MPIALHIAHTAFVGTYDTTVLGVSYAYAYVIRSWRMTDDRPSTASSVTTAGGKSPYLMVESITTHISQEHLIDGNGNVTSAEPFFLPHEMRQTINHKTTNDMCFNATVL